MNNSKKKLQGFTLLELVVVLAIIGVLAGILIPSTLTYIRNNKISEANDQAQQVFMAAQDYLVSVQLKGTKTTDVTDPSVTDDRLCWIAVRTEHGIDSNQFDKTNKTTILDSYNINANFKSKTESSLTMYPIADGIESRLDPGFHGSWVVAFYPKTFTVAYAVYNDFYKTADDANKAVLLIGTNGNKKSATDCYGRLYYASLHVGESTKYTQELDIQHPESGEDSHLYTGQYPFRNFKANPIVT